MSLELLPLSKIVINVRVSSIIKVESFVLLYQFLGRAVARAPISGFVLLSVCLSVTVSFWRGF